VAGAGQGTMVTASDGLHFVYQPLAGTDDHGTGSERAREQRGAGRNHDPGDTGAGANHVYLFDYSSSILLTERTSTGEAVRTQHLWHTVSGDVQRWSLDAVWQTGV